MMNSDYERLVRKYLAGEASEAEVLELSTQVVQEPMARRELLFSAGLETELGRIMSSEMSGGLPAARSRRTTLLCYAALTALAVAGWAVAGGLSYQGRQDGQRIAALTGRLASVQAAPVNKELEIIDTRGWVQLLAANDQEKCVTVGTGSIIPAGRAVWTCPWGGVGTRDADGTLISLDRSTVASFSDSGSAREIRLREGIVSVMRRKSQEERRPAIITTKEATVTMGDGQVTVVAEKGRTLVETASGQVTVRRTADGRTVTVSAGHYAIVGASGEVTELAGRLAWWT